MKQPAPHWRLLVVFLLFFPVPWTKSGSLVSGAAASGTLIDHVDYVAKDIAYVWARGGAAIRQHVSFSGIWTTELKTQAATPVTVWMTLALYPVATGYEYLLWGARVLWQVGVLTQEGGRWTAYVIKAGPLPETVMTSTQDVHVYAMMNAMRQYPLWQRATQTYHVDAMQMVGVPCDKRQCHELDWLINAESRLVWKRSCLEDLMLSVCPVDGHDSSQATDIACLNAAAVVVHVFHNSPHAIKSLLSCSTLYGGIWRIVRITTENGRQRHVRQLLLLIIAATSCHAYQYVWKLILPSQRKYAEGHFKLKNDQWWQEVLKTSRRIVPSMFKLDEAAVLRMFLNCSPTVNIQRRTWDDVSLVCRASQAELFLKRSSFQTWFERSFDVDKVV